MAKLVKIILGIVGALVVLIVLAVGAFALFFDANAFRGQITEQVKKATGRDLSIGDIHVGIYPRLGARVQNVVLGNAPGFGTQPFATVTSADVGLALLPLVLHRELQVDGVTLSGLGVSLEKHADGSSNWADLAKGSGGPSSPAASDSGAPALKSIDIAGIDIQNASIRFNDAQASKQYALSNFNLHTGAIRNGKPFKLTLDFGTSVSDPKLNANVSLASTVSFDPDQQLASADALVLKLKAAMQDLNADVEVDGNVQADLKAQVFKLEKLDVQGSAEGKSIPGGKQKLGLTGDAVYDGGKGTVRVASLDLEAAGVKATLALDGTGLNGKTPRFTGPLSVAPFNARTLLGSLGVKLETADPKALEQVSLKAKLDATPSSARINDLTLKLDDSTLSGSAAVTDLASKAAQFALKVDAIDADRYLPPPAAKPANPAKPTPAEKAKADAQPLPLDALDPFTVAGTFEIGKLKLSNLNMAAVKLQVDAAKGRDKTVNLNANLYEGSVASTTRITGGGQPVLNESLKLAGISAEPLLKDLNGSDRLAGHGNVTADISGSGATVGAFKRALNGKLAFSLTDGAVKGINIGQMLRKANAALTGKSISDSEPAQTDFSTLSASATITNGVLRSDDLDAKSPLLRVGGAGTVDIPNETIDYVVKPTVVNTASGQGGKDLENLAGITIPIHVGGTFSEPTYGLDLKAALAQKATDQLKSTLSNAIGKKLDGGSQSGDLKNTLKSLFGNKPAPAPAAPAAAP